MFWRNPGPEHLQLLCWFYSDSFWKVVPSNIQASVKLRGTILFKTVQQVNGGIAGTFRLNLPVINDEWSVCLDVFIPKAVGEQ